MGLGLDLCRVLAIAVEVDTHVLLALRRGGQAQGAAEEGCARRRM